MQQYLQYTTVIFRQYLVKLDIVSRHRNRLYLTVHYAKGNLTILQDAIEYTEKKGFRDFKVHIF